MAVKPNGGICKIKEQIIEDPASGLTFQFALEPESDEPVRLTIYGDLPFGNRTIFFDQEGSESGSGTATSGSCSPSWLKEV